MIEFLLYLLYAYLQGILISRLWFAKHEQDVGLTLAFCFFAPIFTFIFLVQCFWLATDWLLTVEWKK